MNFLREICLQLFFLLILGLRENVYGFNNFKWIPFELSNDKILEKSIFVYNSDERYVGRARHYDEILPAEIYANGTAYVSSCNEKIKKEHFEILTTSDSDECKWKSFRGFSDIDETAVRVGTAWNNEPIFIGVQNRNVHYYNSYGNIDNYENHLISAYLASEKFYDWSDRDFDRDQDYKYLSCKKMTQWIDVAAMNLPNNTVSGGKSGDNFDIYVARLKRNCEVVVGQVSQQTGTATAVLNDDREIEAAYCQALIGEPLEYTWVSASDGEIPDYAVVGGKNGYEMSYIVRINNTIGHLTYSRAFRELMDYEILVMNHSQENV